jgi:hypothetical protein
MRFVARDDLFSCARVAAQSQRTRRRNEMIYGSDLYAGDVEVITEAFIEARRAEGARIHAHVALPGVVPDASGEMPNTPDSLTDLAASIAQVEGLRFSGSIAGRIGRTRDLGEQADGAYLMRMDWVSLFAALTDSQARVLAQLWAGKCDPEAATATPRLITLVSSIRDLCRVAIERSMPVVYTWRARDADDVQPDEPPPAFAE